MSYVLQSYRDGVKTIKFNRPEKKNAMCQSMYEEISNILRKDAKDDQIILTIITGVGDYFTSGNDLKSSMENGEQAMKAVKDMIDTFIEYPKLLIAVVNGKAIGIGATLPILCDIVYATENAEFDTPFVKMGLCVEGCSSYTYPLILGRSKASEVLYLNHKLTATEAHRLGLVSKVIPRLELETFINELHQYGTLPVNSLIRNKSVVMGNLKTQLKEISSREFDMLKECVNSEDFMDAVMTFMSRKSKL
nr:enoyl-CoA delta isomerase 2, mitochondrial-like [Leptinotarsa decemlineata]XP_023011540.1 enoyl-CoA delta isomerase 2, mitochondrial-like [Leptinotarsa decemlineata]